MKPVGFADVSGSTSFEGRSYVHVLDGMGLSLILPVEIPPLGVRSV